jgi:hypothetical protein
MPPVLAHRLDMPNAACGTAAGDEGMPRVTTRATDARGRFVQEA